MAQSSRIPVLIVGGGPVGLALAAELGWRGIACMLVEQGDGVIITPKMNEVNVRTMEFCRRWGIADHVHACPFPPDYPLDVAFVTSLSGVAFVTSLSGVAFVTSLSGYELGRMSRPPRMTQQPEPYSPMRLQVCSQMWFDPILQRFARSFPQVQLRYRMRLESFEASESGVRAEIVDVESGRAEQIEADYLVGCDGANSTVRRALGIPLEGKTLGYPVHLYFRAPGLLEQCGRAPTVFFLTIDKKGLWANVRVIDPANAMWRLMVLDSDGTLTPETVDREGYLEHGEFAGEIAQIEEDSPAGVALRACLGPELVRGVGRMFRTVGMQIGYRYEGSPICIGDGTPPIADDSEHFVPSARPGARAARLARRRPLGPRPLWPRLRAAAAGAGRARWCRACSCSRTPRRAAHRDSPCGARARTAL
ncbi:MAG: FAD-dependent monooxygenase [Hyphomicrobiales bacterium]|nr:FAD-dependent monooxygenase [Hyphomicrobiales bacterium]